MSTETPSAITPLEMTDSDIAIAEKAAKRLGYTQTAYTSSSSLWDLFCLPDNNRQLSGCFIKTAQFGIVFLQSLEDIHCTDLDRP